MAENRGNPSTSMPNGVTRPISNNVHVSNDVMNAVSKVLGTPLKSVQSNTSSNMKLTKEIKQILLNFSKTEKNTNKDIIKNEKTKKDLLKFSDKKTFLI